MRYYRFPDNRWTRIAFGAFLTAILFLARDSMFTMAVIGFEKSQFLMLGLVCTAALLFLAVNRREWKAILTDRRMIFLAVSTVVCLLPMIVKRDWQLMYCSVLFCLYVAAFLSYFLTVRQVARYYVLIVSVLGAYSVLAAYVLRIGVDEGVYAVPVFLNSLGIEFHNFFLSIVPETYVKNRNFGIFREPGVYQFFLIVALYLNNYTLSWKKDWQMWLINGILAVTMLSTFATGGLVELAIFAVLVFFDKGCYRTRTGRQAAAVVILCGIAVIAISMATKSLLYSGIVENVRKFTVDTESADDRAGSLVVNIAMFLSHPLFGGGLAQTLHAIDNNTSSTTILFAVLGVFGGLFHVLGWVVLVWKKERRVFTWLLLGLILAMAINTQNMIADVFLWIFPMMAMAEKLLPLGQRKG